MEDKVFCLIEKMYVDLKGEMKSVKGELKEDVQGLKNDIIRIENDHGKKLDALFDGYKQLAEGQEEIKSQVTTLAAKVERQDVEIEL